MDKLTLILTSVTVLVYCIIVGLIMKGLSHVFKKPIGIFKCLLYGLLFSLSTACANFLVMKIIHENIAIDTISVIIGGLVVFLVGKLEKNNAITPQLVITTIIITIIITIIYAYIMGMNIV